MPGGRKWHVVALPEGAMCGAPIAPTATVKDMTPARLVAAADRCQAPGCRAQWPADLRLVG